jgi:7 transmembrane receptor (rhodopsin family)
LQSVFGEPSNFHFCVGLLSLSLVFFAVVIFTLLAISVDRFVAVCFPIVYRTKFTKKTTKITIAVCWFASLIETLPVLGWNSSLFSAFSPETQLYILLCRPSVRPSVRQLENSYLEDEKKFLFLPKDSLIILVVHNI